MGLGREPEVPGVPFNPVFSEEGDAEGGGRSHLPVCAALSVCDLRAPYSGPASRSAAPPQLSASRGARRFPERDPPPPAVLYTPARGRVFRHDSVQSRLPPSRRSPAATQLSPLPSWASS